MKQEPRFVDEPRGSGQPVGAVEGGAAPPRGGEAPRDRAEGAARDCREAAGAAGPGEPAPRDRGTDATGGRLSCQRGALSQRVVSNQPRGWPRMETDGAEGRTCVIEATCVTGWKVRNVRLALIIVLFENAVRYLTRDAGVGKNSIVHLLVYF